ncbi:MAG: helix-turn-helix domain-containing protein [Terriglobia bacterium]
MHTASDSRGRGEMPVPSQHWTRSFASAKGAPEAPLLSAASAWMALRRLTGIPVSRATFYRWLSNGKIYSMRLGLKLYVPTSSIEDLVKQSGAGEFRVDASGRAEAD